MTEQPSILIGTTNGLFRLSNSHAELILQEQVTSLAAGGEGSWALLRGNQLWRNAGAGWDHELDLDDDSGRCLLIHETGLLIGTAEARLLRWDAGELHPLEGFNNAPTREEWFTPWGGPPAVRSLTRDEQGAIYANVHVGGILRSDDGGQSWQSTIDLRADVHQVHFDPGSSLLLAASGRGLALSADRGLSWHFHEAGLHGRYLRSVAVAGDVVLVGAATGAHARRAAVYRRPLEDDVPFERCDQGLPEWFGDHIDTGCLSAAGQSVVLGTQSGQLFTSHSLGEDWELLQDGLPPVQCVQLA